MVACGDLVVTVKSTHIKGQPHLQQSHHLNLHAEQDHWWKVLGCWSSGQVAFYHVLGIWAYWFPVEHFLCLPHVRQPLQ
jgi:hypothetical protein